MSQFYSQDGPPDISGMCSLKVDNLTFRTSGDDLLPMFEKFGEVGDIYIPRDRYTRESRGFAFVRFYSRREAEDAMEALDGKVVDGRRLMVQMARYGRPAEAHRGGGGRRGGGRRASDGYDRRKRRSRSRDRYTYRSRSRSPDRSYRRRSYSRSRSRSPVRRSSRSRSRSPRDGRSRRSPSYSRSPSPRRRNDSRSYSRSPSR